MSVYRNCGKCKGIGNRWGSECDFCDGRGKLNNVTDVNFYSNDDSPSNGCLVTLLMIATSILFVLFIGNL